MNTLSPAVGIANLYRGIWQYSIGFRWHFILALLLLSGSELIKLLIPMLSGDAINILQAKGFSGGNDAAFKALTAMGCLVGSWIIYAPGRILERNVALAVRSAYTNAMSRRILDASLRWHASRHSVDTAQLLTQSASALFGFSQNQYVYLQNTISLFGPLIALMIIAPKVALCGAIGYVCLAVISIAFDRIMLRIHAEQLVVERSYFTALSDVLSNIMPVIALRKQKGSLARLAKKLDETATVERKEYVVNEQKWATIDILASALVYIEVGLYVYWSRPEPGFAGAIALGSVFMVYEYAKKIDGVITVMVGQFSQLNAYIAGYATSKTLLEIEQENAVTVDASIHWRRLAVRDLVYRYQNNESDVLRGFGCTIERGKRYALIGMSGCGKSTLLSLLAGLEPQTQGHFILDGNAIASTDLRKFATLIPQGTYLFEGSITENLAMGDATSDQSVLTALRVACAEFAATSPSDLTDAVDESGKNWSGGQRQRIAVARGLLAAEGSSLILIDEPGNGVDGPTERKLLEQIFSMYPEAAIVVITHRHDVQDLFDQVIIMDPINSHLTPRNRLFTKRGDLANVEELQP